MILTHFIVTSILAVALFKFFGWAVLLLYVGGVLIDMDHYLYSLFVYKEISIIKSYKYFRQVSVQKNIRIYNTIIRIFHNVEFLVLIGIGAFFSRYVFIIAIGVYSHILMDIISELKIFKYITPRFSLLGFL
jgi:hypothetical protein